MLQNSYLLRFWRPLNGDKWRATLIRVAPDKTEQHFGSIDDLLQHLQTYYQVRSEGTNETTCDQCKGSE
jgi:hypothetical protein